MVLSIIILDSVHGSGIYFEHVDWPNFKVLKFFRARSIEVIILNFFPSNLFKNKNNNNQIHAV